MKNFINKVNEIQKTLKAPKGQFNSFGKYKYRSCEDILEGLKSVLGDLVITISDEIVMVGDRIYIKATAKLTDGENSIENSAFARESLSKKGMDDSQITGTASSYARKYALNGLLCIDDNKDADTQEPIKSATKSQLDEIKKLIDLTQTDYGKFFGYLKVKSLQEINADQVVSAMNLLKQKQKAMETENV